MLPPGRRGALPGMAPAAPPEPPTQDPPLTPPPEQPSSLGAAVPAPERPGRPRAAEPPSPAASLGLGGSRKVTVTTRTYPEIWDAYAALALQLTHEGRGRVFQSDLVNAALTLHRPSSSGAARDLLRRYRALLDANPPRDLRAL